MSSSRAGRCGSRLRYSGPRQILLFRLVSDRSDPAALLGAAAVVRLRRHVLDLPDLEARGLQGADGRLATGARALHEDVDLAHAVLLRLARRVLGSHLRRERRGLARALEADVAGGGPADDVPGRVGDRHDRVVERALDVRGAVGDVLLLLAADLLGTSRGASPGRHVSPVPLSFVALGTRRAPLEVTDAGGHTGVV